MNPNVKTLEATFNLPLREPKISRWRGAFIEMAGLQHDLLHNHISDRPSVEVLHRYPLVQYRTNGKNASLFALNEGADLFHQILAASTWELNWQQKMVPLKLQNLQMEEYCIRLLPYLKSYHIRTWIPLNSENYKRWLASPKLVHRVQELDRILGSQLIGLVKNLGIKLPKGKLEAHLTTIQKMQKVPSKKVGSIGFNVSFEANVDLPNNVAIGRSVAFGYGIISNLGAH